MQEGKNARGQEGKKARGQDDNVRQQFSVFNFQFSFKLRNSTLHIPNSTFTTAHCTLHTPSLNPSIPQNHFVQTVKTDRNFCTDLLYLLNKH